MKFKLTMVFLLLTSIFILAQSDSTKTVSKSELIAKYDKRITLIDQQMQRRIEILAQQDPICNQLSASKNVYLNLKEELLKDTTKTKK